MILRPKGRDDCCCKSWKDKINDLWQKYQGVVKGIRAGSVTAYPDGDGIADLDGAVADAIAQQVPAMLTQFVTGTDVDEKLEPYVTQAELGTELNDYATQQDLGTKQDTLISGQNIRTINGRDLLGEGNLQFNAKFVYQSAVVTVPVTGGDVTVTGMTSDALVWVAPAPASFDAYGEAGCRCTAQASDTLTFVMSENADAPLSVNVVWVI